MKNKGNGKPRKTVVKNIFGETIDCFYSIDSCREKYFPEKSAGYLSSKMFHTPQKNYYYDDVLGLSFLADGNGKCKRQKAYNTINKKTGKQKTYNNATKMIKELGGMTTTSFYKQLRYFGNFKNNDYEIYPIL